MNNGQYPSLENNVNLFELELQKLYINEQATEIISISFKNPL